MWLVGGRPAGGGGGAAAAAGGHVTVDGGGIRRPALAVAGLRWPSLW
jgi:hypothetical protein